MAWGSFVLGEAAAVPAGTNATFDQVALIAKR